MSASDSVTPRLYRETLVAPHAEARAGSTYVFRKALASIEVAADFLTCAAGIFAAFFLEHWLHMSGHAQYPTRDIAAVSIGVAMFAVFLLHRDEAYRGNSGLLQIRETERAIRVPVQSVLVILAVSFLLHLKFSMGFFLIALILIPVSLVAQKHIFIAAIRALLSRGVGVDRTAVYGVGGTGKRILSALSHAFRLGLDPVVVIDDDPARSGQPMPKMGYRRRRSVPVQCGPVTPTLLKSYQCSTLVVALPNLLPEQVAAAVDAAKQAGTRIAFLSGAELCEQQWTKTIDLDGLSLTPMLESLERWHYTVSKRIVDVIGSSLLLVSLSPLLLLIALLIRLDSPGPALFSQKRAGRNGELFKIYKFRSMHVNACTYDFSPISPWDSRITRIGRMLRRTSLDELPQLVNVLLGNMALVGPRPEMPFIVQGYSSEQRQRLQVIPGITGLWQLSADRAYLIHENLEYDRYYIRNRGFFMDIAILIHTLFFAMQRGV
jgi:exopolysaccharide biosynthesis polyprenyl glycosylphosphotransferase